MGLRGGSPRADEGPCVYGLAARSYAHSGLHLGGFFLQQFSAISARAGGGHNFLTEWFGGSFLSYLRVSRVMCRLTTEESRLGKEALATVQGGTGCLGHCLQATFHFLLLPI